MVLYEGIPPCRCGGIGRRTGLKIPRRKSYGFDPRHRYHVRRSKHRSVSALRRKLHYVSSFFLSKSNPLRWASIWFLSRSKHRSVSALRRKLHYVSSFFLSKSNPLRWASIWFPLRANTVPFPPCGENCTMLWPHASLCRILFFGISAQTLCDICNSTSYEINCLCHSGSF